MFAVGLVELFVLALVVGLVVVLVVVVTSATGGRVRPTREVRLVQLTRVAGVLTGAVVASWVWARGEYGRGPLLAPVTFGLLVVLATALGETVVRPRRPVGPRSASLSPRRVRDYLPRWTAPLVTALLVLTGVLTVLTTLTASRDQGTGLVRALSCSTERVGASQTPYPGSYYTGPLTVLLLAVLAVAVVASRQVIVRPRGLVADELGDDALRRRSLDVIVAAVGIAVGASYVGLALTAGGALQGLGAQRPSCAPGWMHPVGLVVSLSVLPAAVVGLACVVRLLAGSADQFVRREPVPHAPQAR